MLQDDFDEDLYIPGCDSDSHPFPDYEAILEYAEVPLDSDELPAYPGYYTPNDFQLVGPSALVDPNPPVWHFPGPEVETGPFERIEDPKIETLVRYKIAQRLAQRVFGAQPK